MSVFHTERNFIQPHAAHAAPAMAASRARRSRTGVTIATGLAALAALAAGCQKQPAVQQPVQPVQGSGETPHAAGHDNGQQHAAHDVHWSYDDAQDGPSIWGKLAPEYAACAEGKAQSPVDLPPAVPMADAHRIKFDYHSVPLKIVNNGHTIQVEVPAGNYIELDGARYELRQFHFHHPSEETVAGKHADMVVHLVHLDQRGAIAVVGVLITVGAGEPAALDRIWHHLPTHAGEALKPTGVQIDMAELLPPHRQFYHYTGSLTTPPCTEGVSWNVIAEPIHISVEHLDAFHALYPANARPLQPLNERVIDGGGGTGS
jgi:carbonic anhydrase